MAISSVVESHKTSTVQEFIDLRTADDITYYNYSILQYLDGIELFITNLLYDYEDELINETVTVKLKDEEKIKYRFKPYLLAYDVYGSSEAQFIIMMLNNIIDPKEFDFDTIKLIRPNTLKSILGRIISVNDKYLNENRTELKNDFKADTVGNVIWNDV